MTIPRWVLLKTFHVTLEEMIRFINSVQTAKKHYEIFVRNNKHCHPLPKPKNLLTEKSDKLFHHWYSDISLEDSTMLRLGYRVTSGNRRPENNITFLLTRYSGEEMIQSNQLDLKYKELQQITDNLHMLLDLLMRRS